MAPRSATHVDHRRRLLPRDYLHEPEAFGQVRRVRFVVPAAGDPVSARIALVQHWLIVELRIRQPKLSGASLARTVGVSRQTWSRTALGERWMGETLMAAAVSAVCIVPAATAAELAPPPRPS